MYGTCPGLIVRNVGGSFATPQGAAGYWIFTAPPRTRVAGTQLQGDISGRNGWEASIYTDTGNLLGLCPGMTCLDGANQFAINAAPLGSNQVIMRLRCAAATCPNDKGIRGQIDARVLAVQVQDSTPPSVSATGGTLLSGWRRAIGTVTVAATDNVGIKLDRLLVDGTTREQRARSCRWGARIPCSNGSGGLTLDTTKLSDGPHTLSVQAVDAADNVGTQTRTILLDNTAPATPQNLAVAGGTGWRGQNAFALAWRNPAQTHAPLAGVRISACPVGGPSISSACVSDSRASMQALNDFKVPHAGEWRVRIWLVDAAGNDDARSAAETTLRLDNEAPTVAFQQPRSHDPARLRVSARDGASGVDRVEVEARRRGGGAWVPLPAHPEDAAYTAFIDDEHLAAGAYDLRARAIDEAGNERTTARGLDGRPAVVRLPLRRRASLRVGVPVRRCEHRRARRCHRVLARAARVGFGRPVPLAGRLLSAGSPLAAPVEVWSRVELTGARWKREATIAPDTRGRFRFRLPPGPARHIRFRFPGSPTVRGVTATVEARVRAATTFEPIRRDVVNGEYVTFRGQLKGRPLPADGKLVELQVFTRRRWRTFALPRADERTGRWAFDYRFETISGNVRFRFRARVRREASYPYHVGTSRQIVVRVHGQ